MRGAGVRGMLVGALLGLAGGAGAGGTGGYDEAFLEAKQNPGNARAWWRMGAAAFKDGRPKDAIRCWGKVDQLEPRLKKVQLWIGWAALKLGRTELGVRYLRRALSLDPGHKEAKRLLMRLAGRGTIGVDEVAAWPGYPEPEPEPGPGPDPVPGPGPSPTPEPTRPAADPLDRLGGIAVRPDAAAAEAAFKEARAELAGGRPAAAALLLAKAYGAGYEREAVDYQLGRALLEDERPREAIFHLERARAANEEDQSLHLLLGKAWGLAGDRAAQLAALGRALALDPDFAEAHFHATLAYDAVGNFPEAFKHAQMAIRLDPGMKERLKPRIKDTKLAAELGGMVSRIIDTSRQGEISEEQIEEWAEQVAQLIGDENLEGIETGGPVSKETVKDALVVLNRTRDARQALDALPPESRAPFLRVVRENPGKLSELKKRVMSGLRE